MRWQAGNTYLKVAKEYVRKYDWKSHSYGSLKLGNAPFFDFIEGNVNSEEQFEVSKLYLEQHLKELQVSYHEPAYNIFPSYWNLWEQACNSNKWSDAWHILESVVSTFPNRNKFFLRSTISVTAELFLKQCRDQLERLRASAIPQRVVDSQDAIQYGIEYQEVLRAVPDLNLDIDPLWWGYLEDDILSAKETSGR